MWNFTIWWKLFIEDTQDPQVYKKQIIILKIKKRGVPHLESVSYKGLHYCIPYTYTYYPITVTP